MDNVVNGETNEDDEAYGLSNTQTPVEDLYGTHDGGNDEGDADYAVKADRVVPGCDQQNDECKEDTACHSTHRIPEHRLFQAQVSPLVVWNLETSLKTRGIFSSNHFHNILVIAVNLPFFFESFTFNTFDVEIYLKLSNLSVQNQNIWQIKILDSLVEKVLWNGEPNTRLLSMILD